MVEIVANYYASRSRTHYEFLRQSNNLKTRQVWEFRVWNSQMVNHLRDLISSLSDTVGAWDEFRQNEIGYFQDDDELSTSLSSLKSSAVGKAISTFNALLPKLKDLEEKLCSGNPHGVS